MITSIARYVTDFLLRENVICAEYADLYIYGFEVIQAGAVNIMIVLFMGLLFDQLINGLIFWLAFCMLRKFCGGYHADTYLKCNLLLALNVGMVMAILAMKCTVSILVNCIDVCCYSHDGGNRMCKVFYENLKCSISSHRRRFFIS